MELIQKVSCVTTACDQQWLYLIGEEGILYSESQNRFAGLDAASVLAYRAFDAGCSLSDLLPSSADSPPAAETLQTIYALSRGQFPGTEHDDRKQYPVLDSPQNSNIKICDLPILVESSHDVCGELCRDVFLDCRPAAQSARFHFHVQCAGNGLTICVNGQEVFTALRDDQVGLGLLHAVRSVLYEAAHYDVAFHAAMIGDDRHGVMLCAPREDGKSTLAAYLVARDFALVSDEPALLQLDTGCISPVEMPISVKEGTWKVLANEWPQLGNAPIHVRSDGCRIKLLHPSSEHVACAPQRLTHIVFPKYCPSSPIHLESVSPMRSFSLLVDGGMLLGKQLKRDKFKQFLELVCTAPAFVMHYGSLLEADQMMQSILSSDDS